MRRKKLRCDPNVDHFGRQSKNILPRGGSMNLLHRIEMLLGTKRTPTVKEIACALQELNVTREEVLPFVVEPTELPYGRNTIFTSEQLEVVVIHLPANTRSPIHDHGNSLGCEIVVEGELINRVYSAAERSQPQLVRVERYQPDQLCLIPHGQIHSIVNRQQERLITLNVYSPPIQGCRVYFD
jgi:cysteine dioxygenase